MQNHIGRHWAAPTWAVAHSWWHILASNSECQPVDYRPVGEILARLGDKWTGPVVGHLAQGKKRFSELQRNIGGISRKMLAATLRGLERDGFVSRTLYPVIPPRVEYELTDLGQGLLISLRGIGQFAMQHHGEVEASRQRFDEEMGLVVPPEPMAHYAPK